MSDNIRTLSIAGIALLGTAGLALAGGASKSSMDQSDSGSSINMQQSGSSAQTGASGSMQQSGTSGSDQITLTDEQKQQVYQQLAMDAEAQDAPTGFSASVGATLPSDIQLEQMPTELSAEIPTVADYRFAKLENDRLLIVDPDDRRVVSIIEQGEGSQQQGQTSQ